MASIEGKPSIQEESQPAKNNPAKAFGSSGQRNSGNSGKDGMKSTGMGPGLRKLGSDFSTKFISEAGTRPSNKDYFGFVEMDGFACWAIAESYDNDEEVISAKLAVDTVLALFTRKPTLAKRKLKAYIKEAHRQLIEQSGKYQLKASILIVATNYKKMRYAYCGNCRLYLFRGNNIVLKSSVHSLYQNMIDEGMVPDDGEHGMDESRNILNFLGQQKPVRVDVSKEIILYDEDILLLASWGLWEKTNTLEMLDALEDAQHPMNFIDDLQDLYLSKQEQQINNYTIASVFANKTYQEKDNKRKIIKIALMIGIPLLIVGIIVFIYFYRAGVKRAELIETVVRYENQGDIYIEDENYDRALIEYDNGLKESANLKETKGKKGEENKDIKDSLSTKQRVTQLVVDGDSLFAGGKYDEAKRSYEKAVKEAKYDIDFYELLDVEDLENRMNLCDDYAYTDELIALADYQAALGQNEQALINYEEARKIAARTKNKAAEQDIRLKMETLKSQMKADEAAKAAEEDEAAQKAQEDKVKNADKAALDGDKAVSNGAYLAAIDIYANVQSKYLELGDVEKAAEMEQKILETNEKVKKEDIDAQAEIAAGYIQIGDSFMIEGKFDDALQYYQYARDIYNVNKLTDDVSVVNEKISAAAVSKKEAEIAAKIIEIGFIESEGDTLLLEKDYAQAKEKYRQAQVLYQGINQTDKVLSTQEKIKGVEEIEAELAKKENEQFLNTSKNFELYAEEAVENGNYAEAITYYKQARAFYQNAGEYDTALIIQEKIYDLEQK